MRDSLCPPIFATSAIVLFGDYLKAIRFSSLAAFQLARRPVIHDDQMGRSLDNAMIS